MLALKFILGIVLIVNLVTVYGINHGQALTDWNNYKLAFDKDYTNGPIPESNAQFYYNYNKNWINNVNAQQAIGRSTFTLRENQFTDMRFITFRALLPVATIPTNLNSTTPAAVQDPPNSYNPFEQLGLTPRVEDQGTVCSSSWAYASAKAIELLLAQQTGNISPAPLSAQNLLDCAGRGTACTTQAPQTALDYLTRYDQELHTEDDYPNNNTIKEQGMCVPPVSTTGVVTQLASYAQIPDGDDNTLLRYVGAGYPVIVEFNPASFEFMQYGAGIFQQPASVGRGSQFMVVTGYGTNTTSGQNYWLLQNSFGEKWGENGFIRVLRDNNKPLAKNAVFPYELL